MRTDFIIAGTEEYITLLHGFVYPRNHLRNSRLSQQTGDSFHARRRLVHIQTEELTVSMAYRQAVGGKAYDGMARKALEFLKPVRLRTQTGIDDVAQRIGGEDKNIALEIIRMPEVAQQEFRHAEKQVSGKEVVVVVIEFDVETALAAKKQNHGLSAHLLPFGKEVYVFGNDNVGS